MKWNIWNSATYHPNPTGSDTLLEAVLRTRGYKTPQEMHDFLFCHLSRLHDPMDLIDMPQGVARIQQAIERGEHVAVYGDYDADGITAAALISDYLRGRGLRCPVYIPDRLDEGYGLNLAALEALAQEGITLVITVDCGVTAAEEVGHAKKLGLDMVITDHHQVNGPLPPAAAVINPKRPDCPYPDKELAGVGVAFKFVCAIEGTNHAEALLARYGDLVAVGTVADVMDITGENRIFVTEGIKSLQSGERAGFRSLLLQAGLDRETLGATDISYGIAPRINAAGRMGETLLALSLLETTDLKEAAQLAEALCQLNGKRQKVEQEITETALAMLEAEDYAGGPIVLAAENWHKGVLGIVAARLTERYQEPVILISTEGEKGEGSCRSVSGFDLFAALLASEDCLERFGGHQLAAGITLSVSEIPRLKASFGAYYRNHLPEDRDYVLETDFILEGPALIRLEQVEDLKRLEPCGKGNPNPILVLEGARLTRLQSIGKGKHVKLQVEKWNRIYDCVFFSVTADSLGVREGDFVDLAFTPQCNVFRGKTTVQFLIRDLAPSETRFLCKVQRFCKGLQAGDGAGALTAKDAALLYPKREDFARIWRLLLQGEEALSDSIYPLLGSLSEEGADSPYSLGKVYLCLQVFDELGLIALQENRDIVHITCCSPGEKVDLNASSILCSLKKAME